MCVNLGYMQLHRTLGGPEEVMRIARTFREKKLPRDTLIYLGTGFAPSGWNTRIQSSRGIQQIFRIRISRSVNFTTSISELSCTSSSKRKAGG